MDKRFMGILAALVIIFGGILIISQKNDSNNSSGQPGQASNHVVGKGKSGVTLLEYGDFQCPACEAYEPVMARLRSTYANDIYFQFKNLPLIQLHKNAFSGARAAEAASLQGKFWEMHDLLYKNSNWTTWTVASDPRSQFESYAQQLKLDVTKFKTDYSSDQVNGTINADLNDFSKTGKDLATPSLFLDGQYIDDRNLPNPQVDPNGTFKTLSDLIKAEIKKRQSQ